MSDKPKSKKLIFKGEKKTKKRKAREGEEELREDAVDPGSKLYF
jgi:hypothetical protein